MTDKRIRRFFLVLYSWHKGWASIEERMSTEIPRFTVSTHVFTEKRNGTKAPSQSDWKEKSTLRLWQYLTRILARRRGSSFYAMVKRRLTSLGRVSVWSVRFSNSNNHSSAMVDEASLYIGGSCSDAQNGSCQHIARCIHRWGSDFDFDVERLEPLEVKRRKTFHFNNPKPTAFPVEFHSVPVAVEIENVEVWLEPQMIV